MRFVALWVVVLKHHLAWLKCLFDLACWHLDLWNIQVCHDSRWWQLLKSVWHICGSCTGAPEKCKLLW